MRTTREPSGPLSSLFTSSEAAAIIDFLLSKEQHQTAAEIQASTRTSMNKINRILGNLLDIDAAGIGARQIQASDSKNKNNQEADTYYIRDDTDTGKSIRDLWYHLMQVQTKNFS